MNPMMELTGCLLLILGGYGLGTAVLRRFLPSADGIAALAVGGILLAAAALALPARWLGFALFLPAAAGVWFACRALRGHWRCGVLFGLIFVFLAAAAMLPPSTWDEQVYQVALLKKFLAANSTAVRMDNPYSAYPSLGMLWVLPGFAFGGLCVPSLTVLALTLIVTARFFDVSRRRFGAPTGAAAAALVIFSPLMWNISRAFYAEIFIVLFGFAGALLFYRRQGDRRRELFLVGVMAGAAASVKLTGIGVSLGLAVLLLADREDRRYAGFALLGGALTALPFFFRVYLGCGNPFYPYFSGWFGASESARMVEGFHRALGGNYGVGAAGLLLNGWLCALSGSDYDGISLGLQFPLLIVAAAGGIAAVHGRLRGEVLRGWAALLAMWIFWNLTAQQTRFLAPVLFAVTFLAFQGISSAPVKIRQIALAVLGAATCVTVAMELPQLKHYLLAWRTCAEARHNPAHFAAWRADETEYAEVAGQLEALRGCRVAALWERRTLYFPDDVEIIMPGFQERLTPVPPDAEALYAFLLRYDCLMIRPPLADVDKGIEFAPDAVRLNGMIVELLRQGRLAVHRRTSDGRVSILRVVPPLSAGTARSSSRSSSAAEESPEASARREEGNPRPLR